MEEQSKWAPQPENEPALPEPAAEPVREDSSEPLEEPLQPLEESVWAPVDTNRRSSYDEDAPIYEESFTLEEKAAEPSVHTGIGAGYGTGAGNSSGTGNGSGAGGLGGNGTGGNDISSGREKLQHPEAEPAKVKADDEPDAFKIGILGGTGFGKTYLFQAMVYRLVAGASSGALSYYKPSSELWEFPFNEKSGTRGEKKALPLQKFLEPYTSWIPMKNTERTNQKWYRLRIQFRSGLIGTSHSTMDVEFLDGAGEGFEAQLGETTRPTWKSAYSDARFMIFCLPIWAIFPIADLSEQDRQYKKLFLQGFDTVLTNYLAVRNQKLKVRTVLALTMADDRRCSLRLLRERWIDPLVERTRTRSYLKQMRGARGASRYLASARAISNYLYQRLDSEETDVFLRRNIGRLDLGYGLPALIPNTSLQGSILDARKAAHEQGEQLPPPVENPVPAHVELPLLAALCARYNILM